MAGRARLAGPAGLICFSAGCLMIVLAVLKHTGDYVQIGGGGVLIALGLFWMGKRRGGGHHNNRNQHE